MSAPLTLDFTAARVLVAGDVMADTYWIGGTSRVSPEAPVPVVKVEFEETRPGGAANVALNVVALGAAATVVGVVGRDSAGDELSRLLEQRGVGNGLFTSEGVQTIRKLRVMSRRQQLLRMDFEHDRLEIAPNVRLEAVLKHLDQTDVLVLSDYAKGFLDTETREIIQAARKRGKQIVVDPKGIDFQRYKGASIVTPNFAEFEAVVGRCHDEHTIIERGTQLRDQLDLQALLITRGEHGMTLIQSGVAPVHLASRAREVFDVTGAGDTVVATLAVALATRLSLHDAVDCANTAAGIVVGKSGTATVSVGELRQARLSSSAAGHLRKVVDRETLKDIVETAKTSGKSVVMTNGCFDVLHAGHVELLRRAREMGDALVVAVNDDSSVRRLKGPTRPVNALEQRLTVLGMLECVDYLVAFDEDTPEALYSEVLPSVLVKGGDYSADSVAGGGAVIAAGGRVAIVDLVAGLSTTGILSRLSLNT